MWLGFYKRACISYPWARARPQKVGGEEEASIRSYSQGEDTSREVGELPPTLTPQAAQNGPRVPPQGHGRSPGGHATFFPAQPPAGPDSAHATGLLPTISLRRQWHGRIARIGVCKCHPSEQTQVSSIIRCGQVSRGIVHGSTSTSTTIALQCAVRHRHRQPVRWRCGCDRWACGVSAGHARCGLEPDAGREAPLPPRPLPTPPRPLPTPPSVRPLACDCLRTESRRSRPP